MLSQTTFEQFESAVAEAMRVGKKVVTVTREILGDFITPVMAYQKLASSNGTALFESASGGKYQGRYSIVTAKPFLKFRVFQTKAEVEWLGSSFGSFPQNENTSASVLERLEDLLKQYSPKKTAIQFCGGAVGYIGHGVINIIEPAVLCHEAVDELCLPDIYLMFCEQVLVFDHHTQSLSLILNLVLNVQTNEDYLKGLFQDLLVKLDELECALISFMPSFNSLEDCAILVSSNFTRQDFERVVEKVQEYIANGDVFQVVLSQRFETPFPANLSLYFYRLLRRANPSPYLFHIDFNNGFKLVGASPEVMVRVQSQEVLIRPLAGTRKRGAEGKTDSDLANELSSDPKEQAEHRMLVDLARNDVGKFSKAGSVKVEDLMRVEPYGALLHMATDVLGKLREDVSSFQVLLGSLPAGTLSGAPKIRALQLIAELEPCQRGPYGGTVGWFTDMDLDTCIFIRSAVIANGKLYWQVGAGIVADSDPTSEYNETLNKSISIRKVLEQMGGGK